MSIPKEIEELLKNAEPLKEPKLKEKIKKSCTNCMDYIVCYAEGKFDKINDENEEEEKKGYEEVSKNCKEWHLDFLTYQTMIINK